MNPSLTIIVGLVCFMGVAQAEVTPQKASDFIKYYDENKDEKLGKAEFDKAVKMEKIEGIANVEILFQKIAGADEFITPEELANYCNENPLSDLHKKVAGFNKTH